MKQEATKPLVFLSYTRADREKVEDLYGHLLRAGFKPWMDVRDIEPGTNWKRAIEKNIRAATFFLACMSNNSVRKRGLIQVEIKAALESWKEKLDDDVFLIPVRLEECDVPDLLEQFQWVDLFVESGLPRLLSTLIARSGLNEQAPQSTEVGLERLSPEDAKLLRFLDKVNIYRRPRLLVEGINTDDLKEHVGHSWGKDYLSDILIPAGARCVYILEYRWWQGTNGHEDVSDLVVDFLVFPKQAFLEASRSNKKGFFFQTTAERTRDDGFWEDGLPCFKYTHLERIPLGIVVDVEGGVFDLVHDSRIEPALHPEKFWVSSSATIF